MRESRRVKPPMRVRCAHCNLLYDRETVSEVMAKAIVDDSRVQENCPQCRSNAFTSEVVPEHADEVMGRG